MDEMNQNLSTHFAQRQIKKKKHSVEAELGERVGADEQLFRHLVQSTKEYAIFTLDSNGFVTSWNEGAANMLGYRADEIIGKHFSCLYLPEDQRRKIPAKALRLAQKKGQMEVEGWRVHKDGSRFWASIILTAIRDKTGRLSGFSKVVHDMTLRKNAAEALDKQSELLKLLQDVTIAANESAHVEDAIQFTVERVCQYSGWNFGLVYEVTDAIHGSLTLKSSFNAGDEERFHRLEQVSLEQNFSTGVGLPGQEFEAGKYICWQDLSSDPRFNQPGVPESSQIKMGAAFPVLIGKEITHILEFFAVNDTEPEPDVYETIAHMCAQLGRIVERQRADQALRLSEARFRTIFQSAAIGIELVDLEGRLLAFNQAACRIFGYSETEMVNSALGHKDHPANAIQGDWYFERLCAGVLNNYTLERTYRHKEGQLVWGRSTVSLVRNINSEPQYAICMLEDITERKQMEAEMGELHRRLMEEREEERLHLAQELHDGPIQDLYGLSYSLKAYTDQIQDVNQEPLEKVQNGIQRVVRTLRTMMGEMRPPTLVPFGLEKAIRSHAQEYQESHPELEICLNLQPDHKKLPENVRLALFRIYQASLANVMRHAEATRVEINLDHTDTQVILEVCDNGKGFIVPTRWIQMARTGHLGLVGAFERAEAIGGKLEIESEVGKGTTVKITVPLSLQEEGNKVAQE